MYDKRCFSGNSSPIRIDLIELGSNEPLRFSEVADEFKISQPAISKYFKILNEW